MNIAQVVAFVVALAASAAGVAAEAPRRIHSFKRIHFSPEFVAEGAATGDVNGDGHADVVAGPYWYAGPDFLKRTAYYEPQTFDVNGYSDNFVAEVLDLNDDGRNDIFVVGFPGQATHWYENLGGELPAWRRHLVHPGVDNESPALVDLVGDDRPELIMNAGGHYGYAQADPADPTRPWTFHPVSAQDGFGPYTHGLGAGDVNGDGRVDLLGRPGWWEQPSRDDGSTPWPFHPVEFGEQGGAQMHAYDFDGDGDNDVLTSLNAHGYGLAWFEQVDDHGEIAFRKHAITGDAPEDNRYGIAFSQLHAVALADMDGDGIQDVVTGKRYWAHQGKDPGALEPPVLYWFRTVRTADGVEFVPRLIDGNAGVGTQCMAADATGDGLPDVVVSNKKGSFLFVHEVREATEQEWLDAQPQPAEAGLPPAGSVEVASPPTTADDEPLKLDDYPLAGVDAEQAAAAMQLPEGFTASVFAAEPDVRQPIAMALDDRGRVWVAEAYEYPARAAGDTGRDRILIFTDTDGDGQFDQRQVFAEGLNLVSGLEVGFGGVWVGAAPYLMFIPDRNGDDVPDGEPEILLDGWGYHDTHETLNALIWGPDGWLYGCHGVFTHSRVGKPDTPDAQRVPLNAGVWRYHPVRHEFEVFAHGTSNPWGVDFTDHGEAVCTACVIPHLFHMIQGARYHRQAGQHFNPYTYDDIKTIADHLHYLGETPHAGNEKSDDAGGGHAHAGAMIYLGGAWPARYRGQVFMNNIHGQRLNMDILEPRGSGLVGRHGPDFLLTRDRASQMIAMQYGPDGQVYVIDWYDMQACHHPDASLHDRSNGRIYRIEYGASEPAAVDLAAFSDVQLAEQMLSDNDWYVRHARRLLQQRAAERAIDPQAMRQLHAIAHQHDDDARRLRGMWALHAIGATEESLIVPRLGDPSPHVRAWAIRLAQDTPGLDFYAMLPRWVELAQRDPSPVVRLALASAAGRLKPVDRWQLVDALLAHAEDGDDHNLPLMYWYAAEPLGAVDPQRALGMAVARADAMPLVRDLMMRRIAAIDGDAAREALVALLGSADDAATQRAVVAGLRASLKGRRRVAAPPSWQDAYRNVSATGDAELQRAASALGVAFGDPAAMAAMRRLVANRNADVADRRAAVDALLDADDPELINALYGLLSDPAMRPLALTGLARYDNPATPQQVLDIYPSLTLQEKRLALATLSSRTPYAAALLDAIGEGRVPRADLSAELARQILNLRDEQLAEQLADVWGTMRSTPQAKLDQIAKYRDLVAAADPATVDPILGRDVFARTCQACHTLYGIGAKIGPDLTGSNRTDLDYLLGNIVDPSALIAKEYQTTVVLNDSGRVFSGIVTTEDEHSVTLENSTETIVIPKKEIDERSLSELSLMPDNQLEVYSPVEIASLVAYLRGDSQAAPLAGADGAPPLFNGADLTGWRGDPSLWSVDQGEIVGRTAAGLDRNSFLVSELAADDFELSLEVKLLDNVGNSGIQFRSRARGDEVAGYQADIGPDWWGKLYEEHGRALLWDQSGEEHVVPGAWNAYVIRAEGARVRTWINGAPCVDLTDPDGAGRGLFALQLHSGGPTEVRFRNLKLTPLRPASTQ